MNRPVGIALLAIGIMLMVFGFNASESFSSEVSEFFTGSLTDKAIWLLIGGLGSAIAGFFMIARRRATK